MSLKSKIIGSIVIIGAAFAFGRYSAPEKIKIETKTVEVEKKQTDEHKDVAQKKHLKTITVVKVLPDGTKESKTTVVEDDASRTKDALSQTDDVSKSTDTVKEITKSSSRLTLSALAGAKISFTETPTLVYGGAINRDLIGPINIGVFGLSNGIGGFSLGLTF